jgi:DnaK suppressor protein
MNMTSHSPFDTQVLLQFKASLQRQQRELRHVIGKTDKEIRALADLGPLDAVDLSCGNSLKESMFAHGSQVRRQLRLVELALERIRKGEFGICAACEGVIGLKRLEAVPWARHCIQCQERFEHVRGNASMVELYSGDAAQR